MTDNQLRHVIMHNSDPILAEGSSGDLLIGVHSAIGGFFRRFFANSRFAGLDVSRAGAKELPSCFHAERCAEKGTADRSSCAKITPAGTAIRTNLASEGCVCNQIQCRSMDDNFLLKNDDFLLKK